ncbi:cell division protein FtsQ/DivIB [Flavobacterium sp.]|jgi:cell division protein FtsQ|uniref:cell division protein FtsQ/DivIB n=1 Tax=Flavobacterium sp. TaxID=239 RepID=UPI0037C12D65
MKRHFNWTNLRLVLILSMVVFLYSFSSIRNEQRKLLKSTIEFIGKEQLFVTHETVNKLLIENNKDASAIRKVALDLNSLEKSINNHEMIEKSEVFVSVDGVLKAVVKQKTPVARVVSSQESYYLDYMGTKMPLSEIHTARVPLVIGNITNENSELVNELFRYIHADEFLKKNIIGVEILPSGSVKMKNRNFDFTIDFGKIIKIEEKFKNYQAFYQKAVQDKTIEKYKNINLKFTQQVVCTK